MGESRRLQIPVPDCPPLEQSFSLGGRLWLPEEVPDEPVLLCCLPGGGMNHGYFDLRDAQDEGRFSLAEAMCDRGYLVAALDHVGTGDSSTGVDRFELTPRLLGKVAAKALDCLDTALRAGVQVPGLDAMPGLRKVCVAHSMGAMLSILMQSEHALFDGLVLLGFSTRGLPEYLPPLIASELESTQVMPDDQTLVAWARQLFGTSDRARAADSQAQAALFGTEHADPAGLKSLQGALDKMLPSGAMQAMLPGNVASFAARIKAPVLSVVGDQDMTGPSEEIPMAFAASASSRLLVLPRTGHCHFAFPSRQQLWEELDRWARTLPLTKPN